MKLLLYSVTILFFVHGTIIFTVGFTLFFHALVFLSNHSFQTKWK